MAKKLQLHGSFPSKAGDSAYQVAQKNGFEGTEQEWLDSLVGKSAYQYAKDAGYNGSEADFANRLAAEAIDKLVLVDAITGVKYNLSVCDGKLTMEESEE